MATPTLVGSATTASSSSGSYTCNKPTGVAQNDLLLSLQFATTTLGSITSGWSQLRTSSAGILSRVGMKVAGASEGANYTFTQGGVGDDGCAIIIAWRDVLAGSTPVSAVGTTSTGSNVITPSVTPGGDDDVEVRFACAAEVTAFTAPSGMTLRASVSVSSFFAAGCATRTLSSGAATGTVNFPANATPDVPHGYTITIQGGSAFSSPRIFVATSAAVHRAANF